MQGANFRPSLKKKNRDDRTADELDSPNTTEGYRIRLFSAFKRCSCATGRVLRRKTSTNARTRTVGSRGIDPC